MYRYFNIFLILLFLIPTVLSSQDSDSISALPNEKIENASEAFVVFDVDTLFKLTSNFGAYTPAERDNYQ